MYNLAAAAQQPLSVQTHEFEGQMTEWERQSVRPSVKEGEPTNDRQVTSIEVGREEGERSFEINLVAGGNFGGYNHSTPSSLLL